MSEEKETIKCPKCITAIIISLVIIIMSIVIYFCLPAKIILGNHATAYLNNNRIIRDVDIDNSNNHLIFDNKYTSKSENIDIEVVEISFAIDQIGLKFTDLNELKNIDVPVMNSKTKDIRIVNFKKDENNESILKGTYKIK